jgi:hypothetical protein
MNRDAADLIADFASEVALNLYAMKARDGTWSPTENELQLLERARGQLAQIGMHVPAIVNQALRQRVAA